MIWNFVCLQSIFIWICFDLVYFYGCIEISIVFKKKDHDCTLYTSREIDWFGIKDNIIIEGYKLKIWMVGKPFFSLFSNYHDWKNLIHAIFLSLAKWLIIWVDENFNIKRKQKIYNFYLLRTQKSLLKKY